MSHTKKIQDWIDRISYKPNYKIWINGEGFLAVRLIFIVRTNCAFTEKQNVEIAHPRYLSFIDIDLMEFEWFCRWVRCCWRDIEIHELDEFFRVDGKIFNSPHKHDRRIA